MGNPGTYSGRESSYPTASQDGSVWYNGSPPDATYPGNYSYWQAGVGFTWSWGSNKAVRGFGGVDPWDDPTCADCLWQLTTTKSADFDFFWWTPDNGGEWLGGPATCPNWTYNKWTAWNNLYQGGWDAGIYHNFSYGGFFSNSTEEMGMSIQDNIDYFPDWYQWNWDLERMGLGPVSGLDFATGDRGEPTVTWSMRLRSQGAPWDMNARVYLGFPDTYGVAIPDDDSPGGGGLQFARTETWEGAESVLRGRGSVWAEPNFSGGDYMYLGEAPGTQGGTSPWVDVTTWVNERFNGNSLMWLHVLALPVQPSVPPDGGDHYWFLTTNGPVVEFRLEVVYDGYKTTVASTRSPGSIPAVLALGAEEGTLASTDSTWRVWDHDAAYVYSKLKYEITDEGTINRKLSRVASPENVVGWNGSVVNGSPSYFSNYSWKCEVAKFGPGAGEFSFTGSLTGMETWSEMPVRDESVAFRWDGVNWELPCSSGGIWVASDGDTAWTKVAMQDCDRRLIPVGAVSWFGDLESNDGGRVWSSDGSLLGTWSPSTAQRAVLDSYSAWSWSFGALGYDGWFFVVDGQDGDIRWSVYGEDGSLIDAGVYESVEMKDLDPSAYWTISGREPQWMVGSVDSPCLVMGEPAYPEASYVSYGSGEPDASKLTNVYLVDLKGQRRMMVEQTSPGWRPQLGWGAGMATVLQAGAIQDSFYYQPSNYDTDHYPTAYPPIVHSAVGAELEQESAAQFDVMNTFWNSGSRTRNRYAVSLSWGALELPFIDGLWVGDRRAWE